MIRSHLDYCIYYLIYEERELRENILDLGMPSSYLLLFSQRTLCFHWVYSSFLGLEVVLRIILSQKFKKKYSVPWDSEEYRN